MFWEQDWCRWKLSIYTETITFPIEYTELNYSCLFFVFVVCFARRRASKKTMGNAAVFVFAVFSFMLIFSLWTLWCSYRDDTIIIYSHGKSATFLGYLSDPPPPPKVVLSDPPTLQRLLVTCQKFGDQVGVPSRRQQMLGSNWHPSRCVYWYHWGPKWRIWSVNKANFPGRFRTKWDQFPLSEPYRI